VSGRRPAASELLETPGALLLRTDLRDLGLTRTQVDAVFRALDVVVFPGSRRPAVKREDYLELVERCTYRDDRLRPT
jgi:fructose-1-phosphate kinase PfkB-like protein